MAKSADNGMLWALGAVGALALGSMVARGASTGCSSCGGPLRRGSRDVDVDGEEDVEAQGKGYLQKQRFDARAGFFVSIAKMEALDVGYDSFRERSLVASRSALRGGLTDPAFVRMEEAQWQACKRAGLGPVKGLLHFAKVQDPKHISDYAVDKTSDPVKQLDYAVDLYAKRAWTLHVLAETESLDPDSRLPVYTKAGTRAPVLFDGIDFQTTLPGKPSPKRVEGVTYLGEVTKERSMPHLEMWKRGVRVGYYFLADIGSLISSRGTRRVPLLTLTSKMSTVSFGLPAGSRLVGGTCPGADVKAQTGMVELDRTKVCDICYAMGANYGRANVMTQQEARKRWVEKLLEKGAETCGRHLAAMIDAYARYAMESKRQGIEIGVWDGKGIVVPSRAKGTTYAFPTQLSLASVGKTKLPKNTQDWFASKRINPGSVAGFFRIHDSGDFGVGASPASYIEAWRCAAQLLPQVQFWAPSRMWPMKRTLSTVTPEQKAWMGNNLDMAAKVSSVKPSWVERKVVSVGSANDVSEDRALLDTQCLSPGEVDDLERKTDEAKRVVNVPSAHQIRLLHQLADLRNFTLRPSGLYVRRSVSDPIVIPTFDGMVGSGVSAKENVSKKKTYPPMVDSRGVLAWQCPVYTKNAEGKEATSCQAANCRACWIAKDLPIFYGAH